MESTKFLLFLLVAMPYFLAVAHAGIKNIPTYIQVEECESKKTLDECRECCEAGSYDWKFVRLTETERYSCRCHYTKEQRKLVEAGINDPRQHQPGPMPEDSPYARARDIGLPNHSLTNSYEAEPETGPIPGISFTGSSRFAPINQLAETQAGDSSSHSSISHNRGLEYIRTGLAHECDSKATGAECEDCCKAAGYDDYAFEPFSPLGGQCVCMPSRQLRRELYDQQLLDFGDQLYLEALDSLQTDSNPRSTEATPETGPSLHDVPTGEPFLPSTTSSRSVPIHNLAATEAGPSDDSNDSVEERKSEKTSTKAVRKSANEEEANKKGAKRMKN